MKPLLSEDRDGVTLQNLGRASLQIIHDIKNQLNGLKLYATYLRKRMEKSDEASELQETVAKFAAEAGGEAASTARSVGQAVASEVGSAASGIAEAGAQMASTAKEQVKTFASELEAMARKNPLGTIAGTLVAGIVIGMMSRGRS